MGKREKRPSWFKMFRHQKALIDSVPDAEVGRAIKAVFQYFENGETPDMTPVEFAVFSSMKPYVDESFSDFARNSKKNVENINKRWEKQRDMGTMYRRGDIVAIQYSFRDKPAIFDLLIGHCLKNEYKPCNGGTTHE